MSRMTDYCDVMCDTEDCGMWVPTGERTLPEARRYLHRLEPQAFDGSSLTRIGGWKTIKGKDYCPTCVENGKIPS